MNTGFCPVAMARVASISSCKLRANAINFESVHGLALAAFFVLTIQSTEMAGLCTYTTVFCAVAGKK